MAAGRCLPSKSLLRSRVPGHADERLPPRRVRLCNKRCHRLQKKSHICMQVTLKILTTHQKDQPEHHAVLPLVVNDRHIELCLPLLFGPPHRSTEVVEVSPWHNGLAAVGQWPLSAQRIVRGRDRVETRLGAVRREGTAD